MCKPIVDRFLSRCFIGSIGIQAAYSMYNVKDATVRIYNREKRDYVKKNMLIADKGLVVLFSTCMAPVLLPFHLISAVNKFQIYMQGDRPEDYGIREKDNVIDYIFP